MHAVIVDVSISDRQEAQRQLNEQVVPMVSQAPGFVGGYWLAVDDSHGHSIAVFESEEAARGVADRVSSNAPSPVNVENVQVCEVVASA